MSTSPADTLDCVEGTAFDRIQPAYKVLDATAVPGISVEIRSAISSETSEFTTKLRSPDVVNSDPEALAQSWDLVTNPDRFNEAVLRRAVRQIGARLLETTDATPEQVGSDIGLVIGEWEASINSALSGSRQRLADSLVHRLVDDEQYKQAANLLKREILHLSRIGQPDVNDHSQRQAVTATVETKPIVFDSLVRLADAKQYALIRELATSDDLDIHSMSAKTLEVLIHPSQHREDGAWFAAMDIAMGANQSEHYRLVVEDGVRRGLLIDSMKPARRQWPDSEGIVLFNRISSAATGEIAANAHAKVKVDYDRHKGEFDFEYEVRKPNDQPASVVTMTRRARRARGRNTRGMAFAYARAAVEEVERLRDENAVAGRPPSKPGVSERLTTAIVARS